MKTGRLREGGEVEVGDGRNVRCSSVRNPHVTGGTLAKMIICRTAGDVWTWGWGRVGRNTPIFVESFTKEEADQEW